MATAPAVSQYEQYDLGSRFFWFGIISGLILVFLCGFFWFLFDLKAILAGASVWAVIMAIFGPKMFLVQVLELESKVMVNAFTGTMTAYKSGAKLKYPWEQESEEGNHGRVERRPYQAKGTKTTPAKDGAVMEGKWLIQYRPHFDDDNIDPAFLTMKEDKREEIIQNGLNADVGSYLSEQTAGQDSETIRTDVAKKAREHFQAIFVDNDERHLLERIYGIEILEFRMEDLDYSEEAQKSRSELFAAKQTKLAAESLAEIKGQHVGGKNALNAALVNKGKATKNITEIEGEGANAAVAVLKEIFGKGGR